MFLKKIANSFISHTRFLSKTNIPLTNSVLEKWKVRFEQEKIPEIDSSINNILSCVLQQKRVKYEDLNLNLTEEQEIKFEELCECRMARMPIQYIIGEWDFRDLTLSMIPPVFIPRPETEELVELILQKVDVEKCYHFLEIGCGTGAISLSLLKSLPKSLGMAVDQSKMAIDLTTKNATKYDLQNRIEIIHKKVTDDTKLENAGEFDFIVSNPPYVKTKDLLVMEPEIKLYEDLRALDGGDDGLKIIKPILNIATHRLKKHGSLWMEVDSSHPKMIEKYIEENQDKLQLKYVASYQDLFHKDRFVEIIKV